MSAVSQYRQKPLSAGRLRICKTLAGYRASPSSLDSVRITSKPECAGINRHVVGDERARAAMLADVPMNYLIDQCS
jgi:hypothetical protein